MQLQVEREDLGPCRVALTIRVAAEEVERRRQAVFTRFAKRVNVPGFRPGKAPRHLVSRLIDQSQVNNRAAEELVEQAYTQAATEQQLHPYSKGEPSLEILEGTSTDPDEPVTDFVFKCTFPLEWSVELGSLEGLKARRVLVQIGDEDVERELNRLAEEKAHYHETDEPVSGESRVRASLSVVHDGETLVDEGRERPVLLQVGENFPEVDEALLGMTSGEHKEFVIRFGEDYPEESLRGKEAVANVQVHAVLERHVPEVSDALAQQHECEDLAAWRASVRQDLEREATRLANSEVHEELLRQVIERSTIRIPDEMLQERANAMLREFANRLSQEKDTLRDFLRRNNQSMSDLNAQALDEARNSLNKELVLVQLSEQFDSTAPDGVLERMVQAVADSQQISTTRARRMLEKDGMLGRLESDMIYQVTMGRLRSLAEIEESVQ